MKPTYRFVPTLIALTVSAAALTAQDWTQWRGPARSGVVATFKPPVEWPERPTQVWKVQVGLGHSSPVVVGSRVYQFARAGEQEVVAAYDLASGKEIWRQGYEAPYEMNPAARGHGKGPKSTPVADAGRLYTFGIDGVLTAWELATGRVAWRKDFAKDFPETAPDFGVAMSPAVSGGLLLVHVGGNGNGALLALDTKSGDVRWTWKGDGPAYTSPVVATIDGTTQVITQSQRRMIGVAIRGGQLLWDFPFTTAYDQNIVTPVVAGEVVIYSGLSRPLTAMRVSAGGGAWTTTEMWKNDELPMYMSSPVLAGGYLFGLTHRNRGQFFCADAKTGQTLWITRGREGENAALIKAGDLLMATTTEGELVIAPASPKAFTPIRRYTIAESPVWAHPVPAGDGVLIKDLEHLAYWRFR